MGAKVTFDIITRTIFLTEAPVIIDGQPVVNIDVRRDLYSAGKEDWLDNEEFRALIFPITAIGGQSIPGGRLDATFFLRPDWSIQPFNADHRLLVNGNFFSEDGTSPFLPVPGSTVTIEQTLSAIVQSAFADTRSLAREPDVFYDSNNGVPGTDGRVGSLYTPSNNEPDTLVILIQNERQNIQLLGGVFTFPQDIDNVSFIGSGDPALVTVDLNGFDATRCRFQNVTLTGDAGGQRIVARNCVLDGLSNVHGYFDSCRVRGMTLDDTNQQASFFRCSSDFAGATLPVVDCDGREGSVNFHIYSGNLELRGLVSPLASVSVEMNSGHLLLDASCTDVDTFVLRGVGYLTNNSSLELDEEGFTGTFLGRTLSIVKAILGLS